MKKYQITAILSAAALLCIPLTGCEQKCSFSGGTLSDDVELSAYPKTSYFWFNCAEDKFDPDNLEFISESPDVATFDFDESTTEDAVYFKITPISDGETDAYIRCKVCGGESGHIHITVDGAPEQTTVATTKETTAETTTTAATETEPPEANGYTVPHGTVLSAISNEIDEKNVFVVKVKIKSSYSNKTTIDQNYYNIENLVKTQECDKFDEIQYWAVADMTDGSESKVISFTLDSDAIQGVKNGTVFAANMEDHIYDLWTLPSLQD